MKKYLFLSMLVMVTYAIIAPSSPNCLKKLPLLEDKDKLKLVKELEQKISCQGLFSTKHDSLKSKKPEELSEQEKLLIKAFEDDQSSLNILINTLFEESKEQAIKEFSDENAPYLSNKAKKFLKLPLSNEVGYIRAIEDYKGEILSIGGDAAERAKLKEHDLYVINIERAAQPDIVGTMENDAVSSYLPNNHFNFVMMREVPYSKKNFSKMYSSVLRVLKPNGKFIGRLSEEDIKQEELKDLLARNSIRIDILQEKLSFQITKTAKYDAPVPSEKIESTIRDYVFK